MKKFAVLIIALVTSLSNLTFAQKESVYSTRGGAIKGYDPVAYFTERKAIKGSDSYTFEWNDAQWYFSTKENLEAFETEPEKYAPQYGGYCAYAVAHGYTAKIDPEAWEIVDDKLYLNYNKSVQGKWEASQSDFIDKADENWPKVVE
ncbi:MAG: YHS domain-containing (seleno)protein [Bacteroidota bacterium]